MPGAALARAELAQQPSLLEDYSFEISCRDADRLGGIAGLVPAGTAVSITHLASESDDARIAAARKVQALGFVPVPHVAARRIPSEAALHHFLAGLRAEAQVDRLFVIAGDTPRPVGPFDEALAVIAGGRLAEHGIKAVGIGGYPEGHPKIADDALSEAMRRKLDSLAGQGIAAEIVTQFAFDAAPITAWLARLREGGVEAPVRLGVPGPASVGALLRFAAHCGVGASTRVMKKYGASLTRLLSTTGPDRLYDELTQTVSPYVHGRVGIHLYSFGGLQKMAEWAHANAPRSER